MTSPEITAFCMASAAAWNRSAASRVTKRAAERAKHLLDAAPRIEHPQPVAGMQRRDRHAGARPDLEQAFPGEALDRLAHRRAAEADPLDQRAFGGDAARRQFERHDHALQRPVGRAVAGSERYVIGDVQLRLH